MLDYILRFIVTILIITGIAFLLPTLVVFFLQVAITACVFFVIVFVLSLFYKGDKDESIHTEQFSHQHDLEHRELFGENLRYVIEEFEL